MSAHCNTDPALDWADDEAIRIVADYSTFTFTTARRGIAERLRLIFAKGELEGLKKSAQLAAAADDAVAETP